MRKSRRRRRLPENLGLLPDARLPARLRLLSLLLSLADGGGSAEVTEQLRGRFRHFADGALERFRIGGRRLREARHLAHVLQRGGADLLLGGGRLEIVEDADVPAHASIL